MACAGEQKTSSGFLQQPVSSVHIELFFRFALSATDLLTWLPVHLGAILKSGTFQVYKKKRLTTLPVSMLFILNSDWSECCHRVSNIFPVFCCVGLVNKTAIASSVSYFWLRGSTHGVVFCKVFVCCAIRDAFLHTYLSLKSPFFITTVVLAALDMCVFKRVHMFHQYVQSLV